MEVATFRLTGDDKARGSGEYTIHIRVCDNAGNHGDVKTIRYKKHLEATGIGLVVSPNKVDLGENVYSDTAFIKTAMAKIRVPFTEGTLKLYDSEGKEAMVIDDKIYRTMTIPFDTRTLTNGTYTLKYHVKDMFDFEKLETATFIIRNDVGLPEEINLAKNYGSESTVDLLWNWDKVVPVDFSHLEYSTDGAIWSTVSNSAIKEGNETLDTNFAEDGIYTVQIKSVGKNENENYTGSESCEFTYVKDSVNPNVQISEYTGGILSGTVTDTNLKRWVAGIKQAGSDNDFTILKKGINEVNGGVITDLGDLSGFDAGTYTLRLRGTDYAGNTSYSDIEIVISEVSGIEEKIMGIKGFTEGVNSIPKFTTNLELEALGFNTMPSGSTKWYLNGELASEETLFTDNFADRTKYPVGKINNIFTEVDDGTDIFASSDIKNQILFKYGFTADNVVDKNNATVSGGKITQEKNNKAGYAITKTITAADSIKSIKVAAIDNNGNNGAVLKYFIKLDDGEFYEVANNTSVDVKTILNGKMFADNVTIKVEFSGKNPSVTSLNLVTVGADQDKFKVSYADKYKPENLEIAKLINYKPKLTWSNKGNLDLPSDISYEVHKSDHEDFNPNDDTLIAENLKQFYFTDIEPSDSVAYYKVRAVETATTGTEVTKDYSAYETILCEDVLNREEIAKPIGTIENRGYLDFNTPNANMSIEKAEGNLLYTKNDIQGSSAVFNLSLDRSYNSLSSLESEFGKGFDHSFNQSLLFAKNIEGTGKVPVFKDTDTKFYEFKTHDAATNIYYLDTPSDMEIKEETTTKALKYNDTSAGAIATDVPESVEVNYALKYDDTTTYYFNDLGEIVLATDDTNNFMLFERDINTGLVNRVINNAKEYLVFEYNDKGDKVVNVELRDKSSMSYDYDSKGFLTKQTHNGTNGEKIEYKYGYTGLLNSEKSKLNSIKDAEGNNYTLKYDDNKVSQAKYPSGENTNLEYGVMTTDIIKKTSDPLISISANEVSTERVDYNEDGFITKEVAPNGLVTRYTYQHGLLRETITQYQPVTFDGEQIHISDELTENVSDAVYDKKGKVAGEEDKQNNVETKYIYNEDGEVIQETTVEPGITTTVNYYYEISEPTDADTNVARKTTTTITTINEVEVSKTVEVTDCYDNAISEEGEDEEGIKSSEEVEYDPTGNELSTESTEGSGEAEITTGTDTTYDLMGKVLTESNYSIKNGVKTIDSTTTHTYDGFGRETSVVTEHSNGDSESSSTEFNKNGSTTSSTDKKGITTTNVYNNMNKVVSTTQSGSVGSAKTTTTSESYESISINTYLETKAISNALKTTTTDPKGKVSISYQDNMGNTVREESDGMITDKIFTLDGREISSVNYPKNDSSPNMMTTTFFTHDDKGNVTTTLVNPEISIYGDILLASDSILTKSEYNEVGKEISSTDANGNKTQYQYGSQTQDKLSQVTLPGDESNVTAYNYSKPALDSGDNGISSVMTINANGQRSTEATNDAGNVVLITDFGDHTDEGASIATKFEYDDLGNLVKEKYQEGNYKKNSYDQKNRLILVQTYNKEEAKKDDATPEYETSYIYDDSDNILSMLDKKDGEIIRHTKYSYDDLNRMVSYSESDTEMSGADLEKTFTFEYDNIDRLIKVNYPKGASDDLDSVMYVYNDSNYGRLEEIKASVDGSERTIRDYQYDSKGRITTMRDYYEFADNAWSKHTRADYSYDRYDNVNSITYYNSQWQNKVQEQYSYEYDKTGQIISETLVNNYPSSNAQKISETRDYTFDALSRLTNVETTKGTETTETAYTYDKIGNRLSETDATGTVNYSYNSLNQLLNKTDANDAEIATYTFDDNGNQLKEIDLTTGITTENEFDSLNQITKTTITNNDTVVSETSNIYNGNGQRTKKTVTSGSAVDVNNYYYLNSLVAYTTDEDGDKTSENVIGANDNVIFTKRYEGSYSGKYYSYNKDARGSTMTVLNDDGAFLTGYSYDEFGVTTKFGDQDFDNEICYTGGIYDESTGQYYLNARYYDPANSRFLSQDTYRGEKENPRSLHLYSYCYNSPLNFVDPSGHKPLGKKVRIYLGAHGAMVDKQKKVFHASVIVFAGHKNKYYKDKRFKNKTKNSKYGGTRFRKARYVTFGGESKVNSWYLTASLNRPSDIKLSNKVVMKKLKSNNKNVKKLFKRHNVYASSHVKVPYNLFPSKINNGYNSNSYAKGLLNAAGINAKKPNKVLPGWKKPVPKAYFGL